MSKHKRKKKRVKNAFRYGPHAMDLVWDHRALDTSGAWGDCSLRRLRVRADPKIMKSQRDETIIHELTHIAAEGAGVKLEERDVKVIAVHLAQMLEPYLDLPDPGDGP